MTATFKKLPASRYNPIPFRHGWIAQVARFTNVTLQEQYTLGGSSVWLAFATDWKKPIAAGGTRKIALEKAITRLAPR